MVDRKNLSAQRLPDSPFVRNDLRHDEIVVEVTDLVIDVVKGIPQIDSYELEMNHIACSICDDLELECVESSSCDKNRLVLHLCDPVIVRVHDCHSLVAGIVRHMVSSSSEVLI